VQKSPIYLIHQPFNVNFFLKRAHAIVVANLKKDEDYDDAPDEFIGEFSFCKKVFKFQ